MLGIINRILKSIALVPIILALCFLLLAILLIVFREHSINQFDTFYVADKKDAQFVFAYVIGGIFTLTIFSYTMVMNVLNRNINNYSPRLVPLLLSEKHHQIILGFTSGTIVFSMVLSMSTVASDLDYPKLGPILAVIFAIISVFLFIYFIHTVSQSIHINHILHQAFDHTENNMLKRDDYYKDAQNVSRPVELNGVVYAGTSGNLQRLNYKKLINLVADKDLKICVEPLPGQFVAREAVLFKYDDTISDEDVSKIRNCFAIEKDVALKVPEVGFRHLVEIAVKAMSPALNDPGTAKDVLDYMFQLFTIHSAFDYNHFEYLEIKKGLVMKHVTTKVLKALCYKELQYYLKDDPILSDYLDNGFAKI